MTHEEHLMSEEIAVAIKIRNKVMLVVPTGNDWQHVRSLAGLEDSESLAAIRQELLAQFEDLAHRFVEALKLVDCAFNEQTLRQ